jgi:hypothetical protein
MPIPQICDIVKEARLSEDEKRIQYAHRIITSYSGLMNLNVDGNVKRNKKWSEIVSLHCLYFAQ